MNRVLSRTPLTLLAALAMIAMVPGLAPAAEEPQFDRKEDVIYGRKYGTALTMDVFTPKKDAKGLGVILVVSGGFFSSHEAIQMSFIRPLIARGYTVFAVVHGSQPRYQVTEIVNDLNRAVRFIRHNAHDYHIDPARIGVTGASAGGHLSLMLGTAGTAGNPEARDPVDRESSRVQAVACFFPPTDFLNFGEPGRKMIHPTDHAPPFRAAFDYRELDPKSNLWVPVTDPAKLESIAQRISPAYHVSADDAPTLIIHGDKDPLVPLQQSRRMVDELKKAGVETRLIVKPGAGHGWLTMNQDIPTFLDWFDQHLSTPAPSKPADPAH